MPERDPLDFLSNSIERTEPPTSSFAADLLDQLLDDLTDVNDETVSAFPQASEDVLFEEDATADPSSVRLIGLAAVPTRRERESRTSDWIPRVAAAVLVALGGLALLSQRDNGREITAADVSEPTNADEQLGLDFLTARANYDGAAMRALLTDDAVILDEYGVIVRDDYLERAEFERLTNVEISDVACRSMTTERVSCLFSFRNDIGGHLRHKPYDIEYILTVRDGRIEVAQSAWAGNPFEDDLVFFLDWLEQTHPGDLAAVVDESAEGLMSFTAESAAILATRSPEFETTPPSFMKIITEDPRFSTLAEGLERTLIADALAICSGDPETLFAPTNEAFDRYLAASGVDREAMLGDVALFETFVVREAIALTGSAALDQLATEFETSARVTITVVGGAEPTVQGVSILTDASDIEGCNGAIHGIDDIYSASN